MKVLVTGAGGFIGSRVVEAVKDKGWTAIETTRIGDGNFVRVDVADLNSFESLRNFGPFYAAVHCAGIAHRFGGIGDDEYERVNVGGTKNVAEFAAKNGARHFVHLSSVLVYGRHGNKIAESDECRPRDAYAASKLRSEEAAAGVGKRTGMAVTILRPAPVIGEGCEGNFARLVSAIDRGRFAMVGDGANRKSMAYVGDVADACVRVIKAGPSGGVETFNIAAGPVSTAELVDAVYRALGKKRSRFSLPVSPLKLSAGLAASMLPFSPVRAAARSLETWLAEDVYSTDAIRDRYGFEAKVAIDEAVRRTVLAYRDSSPD